MADGERESYIGWRFNCRFIRLCERKTHLSGEKILRNTLTFMRLIEVKEKARVSDEQARILSSESDAREEEVLA